MLVGSGLFCLIDADLCWSILRDARESGEPSNQLLEKFGVLSQPGWPPPPPLPSPTKSQIFPKSWFQGSPYTGPSESMPHVPFFLIGQTRQSRQTGQIRQFAKRNIKACSTECSYSSSILFMAIAVRAIKSVNDPSGTDVLKLSLVQL